AVGSRVGVLACWGWAAVGWARQRPIWGGGRGAAPKGNSRPVPRHNLGALMIADPAKIDELAAYIQAHNAPRGRVKSRGFSRAATLAHALPLVKARIDGIWGERDATAYPYLEERARALRSVQPRARFEAIPRAGHSVQYQ